MSTTEIVIGGDPEDRVYGETLVLRDVQTLGKPFRYLEGRAVPFDTWGDLAWFREQHEQGSLKQSTKGGTGKNLPLLLFHDNRSFPIGAADSWDNRADGLHGVWRLDDHADAQRAAQAATDGMLLGMSIGFQPVRSEWTYCDDWDPDLGPEHKDTVIRLESRLLEVSLTPTPVFADAAVTSVRSAYVEKRSAGLRRSGRTQVKAWRARVDELRSGPS
jgi:HK97 family phage prohead protease